MSWIKLTGYQNGNEAMVHSEKLKEAVIDRINGCTSIVFDHKTMKVRETIDEIIAKLEVIAIHEANKRS